MKKVYIHPLIQVGLLNFDVALMAGSGTKPDLTMSIDGEAEEDEEADAKQITFRYSPWDDWDED